ncbi:hypothetical protein [Alteromonas sp.]|uniref:hypothetical protein n=1 Tax=Alteromonas sp. TaxID=232 RepID=UPI00257FBC99|nr:hypothetical protein [Alteromonas sp.]
MARLKVLYPGNHTSSGNIGADIENIVRYLNSAEVGDNTISELVKVLFDDNGVLKAPVELRNDKINGLEYRVGSYPDAETGWQQLATIAEIRGPSGSDVGTIGAPLFSARQDFVVNEADSNGNITYPTGSTVFNFIHEAADAIVVYVNGGLQAPTAYSNSHVANNVTLTQATQANDLVTIYKVQSANDSGFKREDVLAGTSQAVFPFVHNEDQKVLVYRNGVLQRQGGTNDYTQQPANSTITFTSALTQGDLVTFIIVEDTSQVRVSGLMTEDKYTNADALIPFDKLAIQDDEVPTNKINGLSTLLANRGRVYVSPSEPSSANAGDMWVDTGASPNVLKFYNGTGWLLTSPDTGIPAFTTTNALQFLRVNSTGGGLEFANVDVSALVPKSYMEAANGVATLDALGRIPVGQLPETFATRSFFYQQSGSINNGDYVVTRAYKQNVRIDAIAAKTTSGTCNVQLKINGINAGDVIATSSILTEQNLSASISIDASTTSREIAFEVTSANSVTDIEITLAAVITNV